jgi:hypothetical protein
MGKSVRQLQREIGSAEFSEWIAFYNLEPWGDERSDYRFGVLVAALKNSWRGEDTDPYQPEDFFHTLRVQTPSEPDGAAEPPAAAVAAPSAKFKTRMDQLRVSMAKAGFKPATPPIPASPPKPDAGPT